MTTSYFVLSEKIHAVKRRLLNDQHRIINKAKTMFNFHQIFIKYQGYRHDNVDIHYVIIGETHVIAPIDTKTIHKLP